MFMWFICFFTLTMVWYLVFRFKRRHMYAMANKVTSPGQDLPFFGVAFDFLGNSEDIMNTMKRYSEFTIQANGGIAKAWLGPLLYYMIIEPTKSELVLRNALEKADLHRFLKIFLGNASVFAPVPIWRPRRKVAIPAFSPKKIYNFVDIFSKEADKLSRLLKPMAGTGNFKMWSHINAYSLDAIMETAMGVQINAQNNHSNTILTAVNESLRLSCERIFHLWLQPDWLYQFFPQHARLNHYTKVIHDFTNEMIRKKRIELSTQQYQSEADQESDLNHISTETTFLDQLINQSNGYNDIELREEVLTFIMAAMDTSAVAIGFTLKLLAKYPEMQQKVFDELNEVFEDSERLLNRKDLPKLQVLERFIKESLRLYPPVPFIIRNADKDVHLTDELILPQGSGIIISVWGVHRNPKLWGPDAHCFDPDRFLPERFKLLHPSAYIPFSYGPRNCLGYQYAMLSVKTALSSILRRYRVVGEPEKTSEPHIRVKLEIMLKAVDGFEVALELR